jgi:hypothetical protein
MSPSATKGWGESPTLTLNIKHSWRCQAAKPSETLTKNQGVMSKKETIKFVAQLIASIATAIITALGTTSCMGY